MPSSPPLATIQNHSSGGSEWTETKRGWAFQRKRHLLFGSQWSQRWLVLYSKPIAALALYEQKSDARPPYIPLLYFDLSTVKAEERHGGSDSSRGAARSSGSSLAQSRCSSTIAGSTAGLSPSPSPPSWGDKLISRLDGVKLQLRSPRQSLEDHMILIQRDSGEKWTLGFELLADREEWLREIRQLQAEAARHAEAAHELDDSDKSRKESCSSRRGSAAVPCGLQVYGVTVLQDQCVQLLSSNSPPRFTELDDPKMSMIRVNEEGCIGGGSSSSNEKGAAGRAGGHNGDDLNQLFQMLLSERRRPGNMESGRVNDLSLLNIMGSFNRLVGKKVQEHIDQYHHDPGATGGVLFDLFNGAVQVELVAQYEDGLLERDVAFANSVVRHELHSLQMLNQQTEIPTYSTLMSVLEYKGFRVLAYWALPLSADTLMLREVEGDPAIVTEPAISICRNVAELFGFMMDYPNRISGRPTCLHTGIEVHAIDPDLVRLTGEQAAKARLYPRGFYFTSMSDMLPQYSLDVNDPVPRRLRPELIRAYCAATGQTLPNSDNYPEKTAAAVKFLLGPALDELATALSALNLLPVDSIEWTSALHAKGVNVSLYGELYRRSVLPHLREHILVEMAARAFKSVLSDQLRLAIRHFKQVQALKVEQELKAIVLEWIDQLVVLQKGRWIEELLIPLIRVKFNVQVEPDAFRQLPRRVLFYAMQYHAGLLVEDKAEQDFFARLSPSDILGFRVREVSSCFTGRFPDTAAASDAALYNLGRLTLPNGSNAVYRDPLFRAELARRLEQCGRASGDQKLMTMAENVAPSTHTIRGEIQLHSLSRFSQPVCSTTSARSALADIAGTAGGALRAAADHLGEHHPKIIKIRQDEYELLQRLAGRLKLGTTSKGNPLKDILQESLTCRQSALSTSIRVLGRSHVVTRDLMVSIGELQQRIGNYDDAIACYQDALKLHHKSEHSAEHVRLLISVARCYQSKGELDSALEFGQEAKDCLEEREREGMVGDAEDAAIDSCYQLVADLALAIAAGGDDCLPGVMAAAGGGGWEDKQVISTEMQRLMLTAVNCFGMLYERMRSHPDRMEGEEVVRLLKRIVGLQLLLARPAQKTLIAAARRLPAQPADAAKAKDLLLRMATATAPVPFIDRVLENAEQNPTAAGMDELRLLTIIASAAQQRGQ